MHKKAPSVGDSMVITILVLSAIAGAIWLGGEGLARYSRAIPLTSIPDSWRSPIATE